MQPISDHIKVVARSLLGSLTVAIKLLGTNDLQLSKVHSKYRNYDCVPSVSRQIFTFCPTVCILIVFQTLTCILRLLVLIFDLHSFVFVDLVQEMDQPESEDPREDVEPRSEKVNDGPSMAAFSRNSPDVNSSVTNRESYKDSPDSPDESGVVNRKNIRESPESPEASDVKNLENSKESPDSPNASDTEDQRNTIDSPENEPDTKNLENSSNSPDVKSDVKNWEHSNENPNGVKSDMESQEERIPTSKE